VAYLRQQLHAARAALMEARGKGQVAGSAAGEGGGGSSSNSHADLVQELTVAEARVFAAETEAKELHSALEDAQAAQETAKAAEMAARADRDKLQLKLERGATEEEEEGEAGEGLVEGYLRTINALEAETQRLRTHIKALTAPMVEMNAGMSAAGDDEEGECDEGDTESGKAAGESSLRKA
jgi:chromosome segregation ATPase